MARAKKFICTVLFVLLACFLSIFPSSADNNTISIGWFGPLSGPVASLGEENLRGIQLALSVFPQVKIKLLVEDDQFLAKNSLLAYEKLKSEKPLFMLSPTYNGVIALAREADEDKIFVANSLDASSDIAKAGEYILGLGYYADGHGQNFSRVIAKQQPKKVAVLYNQGETFTQLIVNAFKDTYPGEISLVEGYSPDSSDFRASIVRMKQLNIDAVLLLGWDESGNFIRQANTTGFSPKVFGLASFTSPGFLKNAGKSSMPVFYLGWDPDSKEYQEIVKLYQTRYNQKPSQPLFVALGYDAMTFILKTLEKDTTAEGIKKNLYLTTVQGLTGKVSLDPDGIVRSITAQNRLFRVELQ